MSELTVIIGIFAAGPILATILLSYDEWRQWRRGRAAEGQGNS